MTLVTELRRRRRFAHREGGLVWMVVAVVLSAAVALLMAQLSGWV